MKKINYKKGFTLIELLVVVAIIGILASVVLASLNTARSKGKAASVQASMSSLRAQAEMGVDSGGKYLANLCSTPGTTTGGLQTLTNAATTAGGTTLICGQNAITGTGSQGTAWGAQITLPAPISTIFCVDSTGFAGTIPSTKIVADTATVAGTVVCQ